MMCIGEEEEEEDEYNWRKINDDDQYKCRQRVCNFEWRRSSCVLCLFKSSRDTNPK